MSAQNSAAGYGPPGSVCIAAGPGWALYWPAAAWQRLSDQEQTAVITAQTALMNRSKIAANSGKIRVGEAQ